MSPARMANDHLKAYALTVDLTNHDIIRADKVIPRGTVHFFRSRFLWQATCYERLSLHNYGATWSICPLLWNSMRIMPISLKSVGSNANSAANFLRSSE